MGLACETRFLVGRDILAHTNGLVANGRYKYTGHLLALKRCVPWCHVFNTYHFYSMDKGLGAKSIDRFLQVRARSPIVTTLLAIAANDAPPLFCW